jgi:hypothetical protein
MGARYAIRKDALGWTVIDTSTDTVATYEGVTLTGLDLSAADDLADLLSLQHLRTTDGAPPRRFLPGLPDGN